jgi:DNA-binding NarL/FixJ family response regulator
MIDVLIVDDERLIRDGFRGLLKLTPNINVAGDAANGMEALDWIATATVHVILLDIRMPRLDGLEFLTKLKHQERAPPCLVLTTFSDSNLLLEAARRGAQGFLSKDVSLEELVTAIEAIAAGAQWFQPKLASGLRNAFEGRLSDTPLDSLGHLTDRELDVLRLLAGGLTNRQIATALQTAEGTVKNQVSSILAKIGVEHRMVAVLRGIEAGWI